jgi:hypothetical protein
MRGDDEYMIKYWIPSRNRQGVSLSFLEDFSEISLSSGTDRAPGGIHEGKIMRFFSLVSAHMALAFIPPAH